MAQFVLFIFGASIGSFINVLAMRYEPEKSFWSLFWIIAPQRGQSPRAMNRSHCPHCRKPLRWYELIPIVSFIIQAGQCRGCGKPISWRYPAVEVVMGSLAVMLWQLVAQQASNPAINNRFLVVGEVVVLLLLLASLATIALIDLRTTIIPDELILVILGLTSLIFLTKLTVAQNMSLFANHGIGLLIGGGLLTVFWAISRGGWMGLGDGKLGAILGLWLGYPSIIFALSLAFITGSIISISLIALRRKTLKDVIPFGPFLAFGGIMAFFLQGWFEGRWRGLWI